MTLRHTSLRTEARVQTVEEFQVTFTVSDETSEEEIYVGTAKIW